MFTSFLLSLSLFLLFCSWVDLVWMEWGLCFQDLRDGYDSHCHGTFARFPAADEAMKD